MLQDIEALEAAKFGGLIAPSDLARQEKRQFNLRISTNSKSRMLLLLLLLTAAAAAAASLLQQLHQLQQQQQQRQ
ncbi:hypothetical protein Emag_001170 [Eimeria magna]